MDRIFNLKNLSLRVRIFLSMIFLTLIASVLIATVSIYQFRKEAREYHQDRLERKETAIAEHINYVLQTTTYPLITKNVPLIFKEKIFEYECSSCGIFEWNEKPITLQLDHINGDSSDHRKDNLQLLCPNCHSQTETWCGRNK